MMIEVLADEVASQIAAGEVVERPASVVKELVENALDAQAGKITIQIEKAGRRKISVADDGSGIPADEIRLAVARHATSKLRVADDLFHIVTLGFRGEALASIGSVSRLTLTSRAKASNVGARMIVEGGTISSFEQAGVPEGTVVQVEDLFYNVPARLKFLKQDLTERRQIDALVTRYAMAYPSVRFHHFQDGVPVLQTSGNGDRREVLANLYGVETARQMLEVAMQEDDIRISGFISPVSLTRSNRREMTFFVNGRWVQDGSLGAALTQAYRTLVMVGRFPMAVLFLELPPEIVDVNVHPAKSEVRFNNPDRIFAAVQRAVRRGLLAHSPVPDLHIPTWQPHFPGEQGGSRVPGPDWEMAARAGQQEVQSGESWALASGNPTGCRWSQRCTAIARYAPAAAPGGSNWQHLPGRRRTGWAVPDRPACCPRASVVRTLHAPAGWKHCRSVVAGAGHISTRSIQRCAPLRTTGCAPKIGVSCRAFRAKHLPGALDSRHPDRQ
jgi:DNA mismatch repair protein MutL